MKLHMNSARAPDRMLGEVLTSFQLDLAFKMTQREEREVQIRGGMQSRREGEGLVDTNDKMVWSGSLPTTSCSGNTSHGSVSAVHNALMEMPLKLLDFGIAINGNNSDKWKKCIGDNDGEAGLQVNKTQIPNIIAETQCIERGIQLW
ncbi:unnamed protein product [Camellia sinensis]